VLATPSDVLEELAAASPRHANWLLPTLLVAATGLILLAATTDQEHIADSIRQLSLGSQLSTKQGDWLSKHWQLISGASVCLASFGGLFWSAFVLWFMGRILLKGRFPMVKALEVAGLASSILVLGTIITVLLTLAIGDASARPALSLFALKIGAGYSTRGALDVLNVFHLWTTAVLALGLSKLTAVSFGEAAFWVFGYWVVLRLAILVLV
jgi:hypothetical protein